MLPEIAATAAPILSENEIYRMVRLMLPEIAATAALVARLRLTVYPTRLMLPEIAATAAPIYCGRSHSRSPPHAS